MQTNARGLLVALVAIICLVAIAAQAGIVPAIIPQAAPTANKRGNGTVFQLAASNVAGAAGTPFCDDGNGNTTESACTGGGGSSTSGGGFPGWSGSISNTNLAACTPCFVPSTGGGASSTTEKTVLGTLPFTGTGTNLQVNAAVAPGGGNSIAFTIRDAGSGTSVACTISGASATTCNDTTHAFTGTAGDSTSIQLSVTGTPGTEEFTIYWQYGALPSSMTLLFTTSASSSSVLTATTRNAPGQSGNLFQSDFQNYLVSGSAFVPSSSGANLTLQMSHDAGATWLAANYVWSYFFSGSSGSTGGVNSNSDSSLSMGNANSTTSGASTSFNFTIFQPLAGGFAQAVWDTIQVNSGDGNLYRYSGGGAQKTSTTINAIRTQFSAGNITTGGLQVYGLNK